MISIDRDQYVGHMLAYPHIHSDPSDLVLDNSFRPLSREILLYTVYLQLDSGISIAYYSKTILWLL